MDNAKFWWSSSAAPQPPGDVIRQSLRFRGFGSNLQRTQVAGNRRTFTYSLWFKKTNSGQDASQGGAGWFELLATAGVVSNRVDLRMEDDQMMTSMTSNGRITSNAFYRDPGAWYHVMWSVDTTQTTQDSDRIKFYINGVRQESTGSYFGANSETFVNQNGTPFTIGTLEGSSNQRDAIHGYLADVYLIDGQALEPTAFGRTNNNGVWVPREAVRADGTTALTSEDYGANGFHLDFHDPDNLGEDVAPTGTGHTAANNFTANGFVVDETSSDYDLMADSPTQNYATLNPLLPYPTSVQLRNANLSNFDSNGSAGSPVISTILLDGIKYWEVTFTNFGSYPFPAIVAADNVVMTNTNWFRQNGFHYHGGLATNNIYNFSTTGVNSNLGAAAAGDIISFTYNADTREVTLRRNGDPNTESTFTLNTTETRLAAAIISATSREGAINFGQRPFIHRPAGLDDTNNLQTQNLPEAPITDGRDHFRAITTGPGSGQTYAQGQIDITAPFVRDASEERGWRDSRLIDYVGVVTLDAGQVFNPLYVWSAAVNTGLQIFISEDGDTWTDTGQDRQNGPGASFYFNGPARYIRFGNGGGTWQGDYFQGVGTLDILGAAQNAFPNGLWWIKDRVNDSTQHQLVDSIDGATSCRQLNAGTTGAYTAPAGNSVAWCWNWDQANPQTNGFNIVDFDASGASVTLDTGLDNPEWIVYYSSSANTFSGFRVLGDGFFELNTSQRFLDSGTIEWQTGANAGEVVLDGARISGPGKLFAWQSISGYSAFGSYTGNGSSTDGGFVYTGFKVHFVMVKQTGAATNWVMYDTTRTPTNPNDEHIFANLTNKENTSASFNFDFLSNGFKVRGNSANINANNGNYIYCAFAENPFGGSNVSPANAR